MCRNAFLLLALFAAPLAAQNPADEAKGADLLRRAQALYERGSFEEARELYVEADGLDLGGPAERFVDFRKADTSWRSAAPVSWRERKCSDKSASGSPKPPR